MMDETASPGPHGHHAHDAHDMDCENALRRLWDYLDGRLVDTTGEQIAAHLEECPPCARSFTVEQSFLHAVRTLRHDDAEFAALRERVRLALRTETGQQPQ